MSARQAVLVIGAGSWGTALAILLARNGHSVLLWGREQAHLQSLQAQRENADYLPGINFPELLQICFDLQQGLDEADSVLIAVPSEGFRNTLTAISPHLRKNTPIYWATKGLEGGKQCLLHQVVADVLGEKWPLAVLSGPTFAAEVAAGLPAALTVAGSPPEAVDALRDLLHNDNLRVYTSPDIIGVEVGGATKNIIAIAAGIADGLSLGANTRAALVTRGLSEIMRLGVALGAQTETFLGLAGVGDLLLTCTDRQSRNYRFGYALAQGKSIQQAQKDIGQVVEGAFAVREITVLADKFKVEMPISEQVLNVLNGQTTPHEAVQALLTRRPREELA